MYEEIRGRLLFLLLADTLVNGKLRDRTAIAANVHISAAAVPTTTIVVVITHPTITNPAEHLRV